MDQEQPAPPFPFRYGLLPREDRPCIEFETIRRAAVPAGASPLIVVEPRFSPTVDHLTPFPTWDVLGNDIIGDCVAVAWANQRRLVTTTLAAREVYPNFQQVITLYKTQNPFFDPLGLRSIDGPGSNEDKGMVIQRALDYLRRNGGPDRVSPIAFASVDPRNLDAVHQAISIFGSLFIGLKIYQTTENQWLNGLNWAAPPLGSAVKSRHAVVVGGYLPNKKFVTWGTTTEFDDSYWKSGDVDEAWVIIWPEHVGTRNFMTGVDLPQLSLEMKKLTGTDLNIPSAPFADLYFIKTRNTGSGMTEIHIADHDRSYALASGHYPTPFPVNTDRNGVFCVYRGDVYYIQIQHTASGTVEIQRMTASTKFADVDMHVNTGFSTADADNGVWTIDGGDLYFIKTKNTGSGMIEIHRQNHLDWSGPIDIHAVAPWSMAQAPNGSFNMSSGDLIFVRWKGPFAVSSEKFFIIALNGNEGFALVESSLAAAFDVADKANGEWKVGPNRDVYFIKTKNAASGMVEVHIATFESGYKTVQHFASWINAADAADGTWSLG